MKKSALIRKINKAAKKVGAEWAFDREGSKHEIWRCGSLEVTIPRHREINELTSQGIMKHLEAELGEDWWRN